MTDPASARPAFGWPAWPLPLLAGLLPLVATVVAYTLSVRLGLVEACNPFIDGCVSISRAARHGLPNHLFRALLLPAAALQALCWLLCGAWLRTLGAAPTRTLRALPWIGPAAAVFLVLYGTFLGTEGAQPRAAEQPAQRLQSGGRKQQGPEQVVRQAMARSPADRHAAIDEWVASLDQPQPHRQRVRDHRPDERQQARH